MEHNTVKRRKLRVSRAIRGNEDRPRIAMHKTNRYLYAQAIDDVNHKTLAAISSFVVGKENKKLAKMGIENSRELGKQFADTLKKIKITTAVFDRSANAYKGNVKAFAEGLRENGITI